MASAYLGPEIHRPLAVISESYQGRLRIPIIEGNEQCTFGKEYENKMFQLLHEHLELGTTDRLVYVGDMRGSMSDAIAEKFCLVHPIQTVLPGQFHYAETVGGARMLPIRIAHVGAEEFFRNLAENPSPNKAKYDRILIDDCVRYLAQPRVTYKNMVASLAPEGRLLLLHRAGDLSTLPYFSDARERLSDNEMPYADIVRDLQACRLDVSWELECLPVRMGKRKWLAMLKERYPTQTEVLSQKEIASGIRELNEGMLKYEGEMVEFMDRQLFISATPCRLPNGHPSLKRGGVESVGSEPVQDMPRLKFTMKMCPEELKELQRKPDDDFL